MHSPAGADAMTPDRRLQEWLPKEAELTPGEPEKPSSLNRISRHRVKRLSLADDSGKPFDSFQKIRVS